MEVKQRRGFNATEKQKQLLVEFVKNKPQLISGKQTHAYTAKDAANDWKTIATTLNSNPGATKDWKGWRKVSVNPLIKCLMFYRKFSLLTVYAK